MPALLARPHSARQVECSGAGCSALQGFLAFGVAEVSVRLLDAAPRDLAALAFWSISLLGGGALVLVAFIKG